jgi:hypothetical protein
MAAVSMQGTYDAALLKRDYRRYRAEALRWLASQQNVTAALPRAAG